MGGIVDEDLELLDLFSDGSNESSSNPRDGTQAQQHQHKTTSASPASRRQQRPTLPPASTPPKPPGTSSASSNGRTAPPPSLPRYPPGRNNAPRKPPADFTEIFSGLRVRNRLLSADDMSVRMKGRAVHRLSALRTIPSRTLESQDPADAWATLGVLVSKSPRRQAANGGSYAIWTLSDLSRKENDVSVFLFQEALSSHWTVCEGMLVAVLGAKVLPDKGGGGGGVAQRLALSVDVPWQLNRVGMSMDYGLCKGKRKDGKACTMPVNKTEGGGYCEFHVVAAFNRAQRKEPLRNGKTKGGANGVPPNGSSGSGNSIGNNKFNSVASLAAASVRQQQQQRQWQQHQQQQQQQRQSILQGRPNFPASTGVTAQRAPQAPPLQSVRPPTLSGILGAGARRREDMGAARTFGSSSSSSSSSSGPSGVNAKLLRPSALRASGRTTMLSTPAASPRGIGGSSRESRPGLGGPATAGNKTGAGKAASAVRTGGGGLGDRPSKGGPRTAPGGASEDLLKLPWAYGSSNSNSSGSGSKSDREASSGAASHGGATTSSQGQASRGGAAAKPAAEKKEKKGQKNARREEGALGKEAPPPREAHPAGYMNGSVTVPAESAVFSLMPQRFPVRADGSRTAEGARKLAEAQVLANQRAVKLKAESQGILLRPRDPNSSVGADAIGNKLGGKPSAVIGAGFKRTNGILGAAGRGSRGGGGDDPLAKKVKTMSAVEKELLLRRVSKYAGLAEEERAKDADRSIQRLEQREAMADKAEEVTKMTVTVFDCRQCKTRRSHFNKHCRDRGHDQKGVKATLRFFECTNCRKRRSSTDRVPQTGCDGCGRHNMWKRCGARPGRGPADGPRDKRFVAAMSEWTDQRDLSLAAPDFR